MLSNDDIVAAVRRSDQAVCEQVAEWEPLECGVAFTSAEFPDLVETNVLRDAWLASADPRAAFDLVEAHYRRRGLACRAWVSAAGQDPEALHALLAPQGWRRIQRQAFGLMSWNALDAADPSIRVLPARAMPKAYRATFIEEDDLRDRRTAVGVRRLDDARYDAFVAMVDGRPAGRMGYLEVGDIARLFDLSMLSTHRSGPAAKSLLAHFLQLARRLLPRAIVAARPIDDDAGRALLEECGFRPAGSLFEFHRPQ